MKIYKVELNPSNPVEKVVKIPVCSNYGIQITWNYEQFPKFTGTDTDTENGYLTNHDGKIEENTSFTEINGQKIYTNLPIIENVGNTIVFYYGKYETFEENKVQNFGSIKVVGVDADDFDVDVGGGSSSIEGISYTDGNLTLSAENEITLLPYNRPGYKELNVKLGINGNYPIIYPENDYLMLSSNGTVIMGRDLATINAGSGPLNLMTQTGVEFSLNGTSSPKSLSMFDTAIGPTLSSGNKLVLQATHDVILAADGGYDHALRVGSDTVTMTINPGNVIDFYSDDNNVIKMKVTENNSEVLDTALTSLGSGGGSNLKWISDKNDTFGVVFIGLCETGDNSWNNASYTNIAGQTIYIGNSGINGDDVGNSGSFNTYTSKIQFNSDCVEIYTNNFSVKPQYNLGQPYIEAGETYIKDTYNEDRSMSYSINIKPGCIFAMDFRDDWESSGRKWIINGKVIDIDRFINEYGSEWYGE